jgi:hypothetical protein
MGAIRLTDGKTIRPRYVTHEHNKGWFVANAAYMAERENVLIPLTHVQAAKTGFI